jgi:DNA-binding transcriptional regulator YhcF (GntR family)
MAEHADRQGYCFPSHRRLAYMCEVSESTVHRMIKVLVARKLVTIERRFNEDG